MTGTTAVSTRRLAATALWVAVWPALMFLLAGHVDWLEGWLFTAWLLGLYATVTVWTYLKDPALLAERHRATSRGSSRIERQDRLLVLLLFVGFAAWIVLIPLDARRFGWSPTFSLWVKASGGLFLLLSSFFLFRAFHDNTFLSGIARIQSERRQRVVSTGVYAFVRHPMYLGMVLMFAGAPLLLESEFGLVIAAAITLLLAFRITREERLLAEGLDGYGEYRQRVRYRLLPFVW